MQVTKWKFGFVLSSESYIVFHCQSNNLGMFQFYNYDIYESLFNTLITHDVTPYCYIFNTKTSSLAKIAHTLELQLKKDLKTGLYFGITQFEKRGDFLKT